MSILHNVYQGFSSAVNLVVEKNRKNNLINRIKYVIREEETKANQAYIALGKYYFNHLRKEENEETEFRRMDELYKVGGASKSEWDAAKTALDVRRTSYNNLLENTQLLSPIHGVVTARNFDNGDLYSSASTPVLVIEQITPVKLLINVSEPYFPKVTKGMIVKVKFDVYGDEEFEGKVSLVYPTIDAATHTFPVEVKLANTRQRIRPGMFGRVTVSFGTLRHVVVPDQAIVKRAGSGDRYVYVYKDGKVSYNKVELGRRMGTEYELMSGVEDNSQVVVAGQTRLADGVEVAVN